MKTLSIEFLPGLPLIRRQACARWTNRQQAVAGEQRYGFFQAGWIGWRQELPGFSAIACDGCVRAGLLFLFLVSANGHADLITKKTQPEQTRCFTTRQGRVANRPGLTPVRRVKHPSVLTPA